MKWRKGEAQEVNSSEENIASRKEKNGITKEITRRVKSIPLQAWTGPWGCGRLRLSDFKTIGT